MALGRVEDHVDGMALAERTRRRRKLGVPQASGPVGFRSDLQAPDEGHLAAEGNLDLGPSCQLEDRARILGHLAGADVAGDAGDGDEVDLRRRTGVEQRERVIDPGVAVDEIRGAQRSSEYRSAGLASATDTNLQWALAPRGRGRTHRRRPWTRGHRSPTRTRAGAAFAARPSVLLAPPLGLRVPAAEPSDDACGCGPPRLLRRRAARSAR